MRRAFFGRLLRAAWRGGISGVAVCADSSAGGAGRSKAHDTSGRGYARVLIAESQSNDEKHSNLILFFVALHRLGRSRREFLQPSNRFGFSYELDNSDCRRLLRGRLYLLPRTCEVRRRSPLVGLDGRIPCVYDHKYGIASESHTEPADRHCLCRMNRYRGCRNGSGGHPLFPLTGNFLASVFHLHADFIHYRP